MKIIIMNTSDVEGGAARCAYRLHKGLKNIQEESTYLVQKKFSTDEDIVTSKIKLTKILAEIRSNLDILPLRYYKHRTNDYFSTGLISNFNSSLINSRNPDIVNLHWVTDGFLPIPALRKFKAPIVWTLHDSWPFTGGCHLPGNCKRYEQSCGKCPILGSTYEHDLSSYIFKRKYNAWEDLKLTIVTDSNWLADCVRKSTIFKNRRVEPINPGLDLVKYKPIDKLLAKSLLSLPTDKKLVLFGAMHSTSDLNKGFQFLKPAITLLSETPIGSGAELVVFGASEPLNPPVMGMKAHYIGRLHDDISLSILYSAADVMVVPSIRESFGQTASEAMACGTPVVAFACTGLLDIIDHKQNGYLAVPYETDDLSKGIEWVLSLDKSSYKVLSEKAHLKAERSFSIELMVEKYLHLFKELHEQ
jgi:glycosyltransferase involved in cell wall biosynthesis